MDSGAGANRSPTSRRPERAAEDRGQKYPQRGDVIKLRDVDSAVLMNRLISGAGGRCQHECCTSRWKGTKGRPRLLAVAGSASRPLRAGSPIPNPEIHHARQPGGRRDRIPLRGAEARDDRLAGQAMSSEALPMHWSFGAATLRGALLAVGIAAPKNGCCTETQSAVHHRSTGWHPACRVAACVPEVGKLSPQDRQKPPDGESANLGLPDELSGTARGLSVGARRQGALSVATTTREVASMERCQLSALRRILRNPRLGPIQRPTAGGLRADDLREKGGGIPASSRSCGFVNARRPSSTPCATTASDRGEVRPSAARSGRMGSTEAHHSNSSLQRRYGQPGAPRGIGQIPDRSTLSADIPVAFNPHAAPASIPPAICRGNP